MKERPTKWDWVLLVFASASNKNKAGFSMFGDRISDSLKRIYRARYHNTKLHQINLNSELVVLFLTFF